MQALLTSLLCRRVGKQPKSSLDNIVFNGNLTLGKNGMAEGWKAFGEGYSWYERERERERERTWCLWPCIDNRGWDAQVFSFGRLFDHGESRGLRACDGWCAESAASSRSGAPAAGRGTVQSRERPPSVRVPHPYSPSSAEHCFSAR